MTLPSILIGYIIMAFSILIRIISFGIFARGKMLYSIGLADYAKYVAHYAKNNRSVTEQVLNLSGEERQMIFDFLQENYLPENREYNYNYV